MAQKTAPTGDEDGAKWLEGLLGTHVKDVKIQCLRRLSKISLPTLIGRAEILTFCLRSTHYIPRQLQTSMRAEF